jgi:hypothetical protein
VIRRPLALTTLALTAVIAVVLGACQSTPQASPVSDPKVILTNTLTSLKDIKTLEFSGSFTGAAKVPQLGDLDLSTMKLAGQADIPNKKAKVTLDAPSLLGTKIDAILIDATAYLKVAGPLAIALNASADKWTKIAVPQSSGNPADVATDPAKAAQDLQAQLDKLPTPPVKQADEKCGDQDCYHVTVHISQADMKTLDPTSSVNGDVTIDVWSRKSDFRPARIAASIASVDLGTFGATIDIKYDVSVSIDAPPADQVVEASGGLVIPLPSQ